MAKISVKHFAILAFLALCSIGFHAGAQMTRNQLLKKYYQITVLHESGRYADAIAVCEEISAMYPRLPDPYLRMAKIYDDAGEESLALLMYGQYASLEMDDAAVAEYLPRIRELEAKYKIQDKTVDAGLSADVHDTLKINAMALAMSAEITSGEPLPPQSFDDLPDDVAVTDDELASLFQDYGKQDHAPDDVEDLRNVPLRTVDIGDFFARFNMDSTLHSVSVPQLSGGMTPEYIKGKWISSIDDENDGREFFILNLFPRGSVVEATLDGNSGLFHQSVDILSVSWKTIQSMWNPVATYFDPDELKDNTASGAIMGGQFSFSFDFKKKKKTDYIKLSKNVLSFVTEFIPLGTFVSKISDGIFSYLQEKQSATTYQTVLKFDMSAVTDNVIDCIYTLCERQTNNGKDKEVLIERKHCHFYRCPDDYQCFIHESSNKDDSVCRALYRRLLSESANDMDLFFPLAYLNYYGVGTKRNLPFAIGKMQTLADKADCNRARYWLASVCYNLSMDEDHYPMRAVRKQFRKISEDMISEMLLSGFYYAYGLQGDIYAGSDKNFRKAVSCYEQGAQMGDSYCLYQLGMAYAGGQLVEPDPDLAYRYFAESASEGFPDAYDQLALCYRNGIGVEQDFGQYVRLLYEAIWHNSINAIDELSRAYFWGTGVEYDFERAQEVKEMYYSVKDDIWKGVLRQYSYKTELLI